MMMGYQNCVLTTKRVYGGGRYCVCLVFLFVCIVVSIMLHIFGSISISGMGGHTRTRCVHVVSVDLYVCFLNVR